MDDKSVALLLEGDWKRFQFYKSELVSGFPIISKMAAFADLNVARLCNPHATEELLLRAAKLGFGTVAVCKTFHVKKQKKKGPETEKLTPINWDDFLGMKELKKTHAKLKLMSRLTVLLDDQSQVHQLSSDAVQSFDILAVQPATEKLFQQACTTLEIDIISLDLTHRLPFLLKFPTVNAAIERGVHFEIIYSPALRDPTCRKNLISTALDLVVFTKGKNIVISSGAENEMDFRGPYDIINLGLLFNLTEEQSKAAVTKNCRAVLFHSEARRGTERSVISGKALTRPSTEEEVAGAGDGDVREGDNNSNICVEDDDEPVKKKSKLKR